MEDGVAQGHLLVPGLMLTRGGQIQVSGVLPACLCSSVHRSSTSRVSRRPAELLAASPSWCTNNPFASLPACLCSSPCAEGLGVVCTLSYLLAVIPVPWPWSEPAHPCFLAHLPPLGDKLIRPELRPVVPRLQASLPLSDPCPAQPLPNPPRHPSLAGLR